jgi:hypothetical protein
MTAAKLSLQQLFLESRGGPIAFEGTSIVQLDRFEIESPCIVELRFLGEANPDEAAVFETDSPGILKLSDGSETRAVATWDDPALPRRIRYGFEPKGQPLLVSNRYRLFHRTDFVTEDRFTGNAGMIVESISARARRYACSNGLGSFDPTNLTFEVEILPSSLGLN